GNGDPLGRLEALLRPRAIPDERILLGDEQVSVSVPIQIDDAEVRIAPIDLRDSLEGAQLAKLPLGRAREVPREGLRVLHQVELAIAHQVLQHLPTRETRW